MTAGYQMGDTDLTDVYERIFDSPDGHIVLLDLLERYDVLAEFTTTEGNEALTLLAAQRPILYILQMAGLRSLANMAALAKLAMRKIDDRSQHHCGDGAGSGQRADGRGIADDRCVDPATGRIDEYDGPV